MGNDRRDHVDHINSVVYIDHVDHAGSGWLDHEESPAYFAGGE